jgi:hypothetical protein
MLLLNCELAGPLVDLFWFSCLIERISVVGWGTMLQAGRSPVRVHMRCFFPLIFLNLPAALWSWGRPSLQQKWVPGIFLGVKSGRCVGLTILPPSVSRMSENVGALTSCNPKGLHSLYRMTLPYLNSHFSESPWFHCPVDLIIITNTAARYELPSTGGISDFRFVSSFQESRINAAKIIFMSQTKKKVYVRTKWGIPSSYGWTKHWFSIDWRQTMDRKKKPLRNMDTYCLCYQRSHQNKQTTLQLQLWRWVQTEQSLTAPSFHSTLLCKNMALSHCIAPMAENWGKHRSLSFRALHFE